MPRIPRLRKGAPEAPQAPEVQPTPPEAATAVVPPVEPGTGSDSATVVEEAPADAAPGFRARARMRRRLRYLRRYRELAFRDLGGLMFDLHRFGRERNDLVTQKLEGLATVDRELRTLEAALDDRQDVTELREAGIAACASCGTLHDTDARFCPGCGTELRGKKTEETAPEATSPEATAPEETAPEETSPPEPAPQADAESATRS